MQTEKFSLKLMLDQSVVLVEYPGREPQLFMPVILDNAITLQNIVFDPDAPIYISSHSKLAADRADKPSKRKTYKLDMSNSKSPLKNKRRSSGKRNSSTGRENTFRWVNGPSELKSESKSSLSTDVPIATDQYKSASRKETIKKHAEIKQNDMKWKIPVKADLKDNINASCYGAKLKKL